MKKVEKHKFWTTRNSVLFRDSYLSKFPYTLFIVSLFYFYTPTAYCQQLEAIASSGGHLTGFSTQISFTIGEAIIKTLTGNNQYITQGVQQTSLFSLVQDTTQLDMQAFPNPTRNYTNIVVEGEIPEGKLLQVFDEYGNKISERPMNTNALSISLEYLHSGIYLIKVAKDSKIYQTLKIVKY